MLLPYFRYSTTQLLPAEGQIQDNHMGTGSLCPRSWMVALNLQDAYLYVPVFQAHRFYLWFKVDHKHFQFAMLPFGITIAPRVFTKVIDD